MAEYLILINEDESSYATATPDVLQQVMEAVRARTVRVVGVDTATPSPFASSLAFSYVANFMYEGDAPLAERRAQALTLDREMLAELLGADELRELIDPGALVALEDALQHLDPSRWARTTRPSAASKARCGPSRRSGASMKASQPPSAKPGFSSTPSSVASSSS